MYEAKRTHQVCLYSLLFLSNVALTACVFGAEGVWLSGADSSPTQEATRVHVLKRPFGRERTLNTASSAPRRKLS